jgi:hypothetical protein
MTENDLLAYAATLLALVVLARILAKYRTDKRRDQIRAGRS